MTDTEYIHCDTRFLLFLCFCSTIAANEAIGGDPRRMPRNTKWPVYLIGSERPPIAAQQQQQLLDSSADTMDVSSSSSIANSGSSGSSSEPIAFGYLQSTTLAQEVNLVVSHSVTFRFETLMHVTLMLVSFLVLVQYCTGSACVKLLP
jgi:hypothetical protein